MNTSTLGFLLFGSVLVVICFLLYKQHLQRKAIRKIMATPDPKTTARPENAALIITVTVYADGNVSIEREVNSQNKAAKDFVATIGVGALEIAKNALVTQGSETHSLI